MLLPLYKIGISLEKNCNFFGIICFLFYTSHSEAKTDDQLFSADIPKDSLPPATSALAFPVHSSPLRSLLVHPLKRTYINNVGGIEGVRQNLGLGRREGCHHFLPLLEFEKLSSTFVKLVLINLIHNSVLT